MRYLTYILRRLVHLLPVAFGITLVVFFMIHLVPGDPARTLLGTRATAEGVAAPAFVSLLCLGAFVDR